MIPGESLPDNTGIPYVDPGLDAGIDIEWLKDLHGMLSEMKQFMQINAHLDKEGVRLFCYDEISEYIERIVPVIKKQYAKK